MPWWCASCNKSNLMQYENVTQWISWALVNKTRCKLSFGTEVFLKWWAEGQGNPQSHKPIPDKCNSRSHSESQIIWQAFEQTRMPRAHLSTSKSKYPGVKIINLYFQIVYGEIVLQQSHLKITTLECLWKISPSFEISLQAWPPGERAKDENRVKYCLCTLVAPGKGEAFVVPRLRCLCGPGPVTTIGDCTILFFTH